MRTREDESVDEGRGEGGVEREVVLVEFGLGVGVGLLVETEIVLRVGGLADALEEPGGGLRMRWRNLGVGGFADAVEAPGGFAGWGVLRMRWRNDASFSVILNL